ncbi:MAG TPA: DUF2383 domain-containing protein [Polyangia bacterium]|jgi:rubrerythrin|nr:DUF2383 domain-containing protein [Polyangia bacterium]
MTPYNEQTSDSLTDQTIDTLNAFLRGEMSAVETYQQALERLSNAGARQQLEECRRDHQQRVEKLRRHIIQLGGSATEGSGAWGTFTKLFEGGAKVLGENAAIAALEEGEDHGLRLYRDDLDKLDIQAREFVEMDLLPAQRRTHATLSALKHTMH